MNDFILCEREKKTQKVGQYARLDSTRPPRNAFEALRRELHLTQENFGKKLGLSKAVVQQYESGRSGPTRNSWMKMKETALSNGLELNEDIYHLFMKDKSERLLNSIDDKVKRMKDKIDRLQQQAKELSHG